MEQPTSIKQMISYIAEKGINDTDIRVGTVISEEPLKITLKNNAKIVLSDIDIVVPDELKKRTIKAHINFGNIPVSVQGENGIAHIDKDAEITLDNSPKNGETVYMLRYGKGKRYFVLGKG